MALRLVFRADRETAKKIKEKLPSAIVRQGSCEVSIDGDGPGEVAEKARDVLEKIKGVV